MSQVLYLKWRPHRWEEVIGQDHVVTTIQNAVRTDRVAHAYLFAGPRGTGKTTTARLLAKAVNCLDSDLANRPCDDCDHCQAVNQSRFLDLIEIDAASNTSVDDVRDLRDKINFSPNQGRFKVYIVDEVHMLSTAAFNALLKTLEEPPPHAIFILATTEVHKIPATVLSRCQRHEFRRIPVTTIVDHLGRMASEESLDVEPEALNLVARQATGSLRDAISLLDQLASTGELTLARAEQVLGTATGQAVLDLISALLARDPAQGLAQIQTALDSGSDARQFARQIVEYLRAVLLFRLDNAAHVDAPTEVRAQMAAHAQAFEVSQLLGIIRAFNAAAVETRQAWQPGLPLELAFVECLALQAGQEAAVVAPVAEPAAEAAPRPEPATPPVVADSSVENVPPEVDALETAATPGSAVTLKRIIQAWPQVLSMVRQQNPQTQGLLNSCKPMGFKSSDLILGFASDLIKSKMEKPEHLQLTQEILSELLAEKVGVRCVVSATALKHRLDELGGLDNDSMVAVAVRDLGGEIVDIQ
jgi:DNA polymerase-3 subunit gamma/tau